MCLIFSDGFWVVHLFILSNFNLFHNSESIPFPTQSCLVLYLFCASLLRSLIMWLSVSSLSPHNLYLLFCCILYILAFILWLIMALFCAAIRSNSVYLLRFLFLSHIMLSLSYIHWLLSKRYYCDDKNIWLNMNFTRWCVSVIKSVTCCQCQMNTRLYVICVRITLEAISVVVI